MGKRREDESEEFIYEHMNIVHRHLYIHMHIYIHIHMHIRVHRHLHIHMHIHLQMHIRMHIHTHMHTDTDKQKEIEELLNLLCFRTLPIFLSSLSLLQSFHLLYLSILTLHILSVISSPLFFYLSTSIILPF